MVFGPGVNLEPDRRNLENFLIENIVLEYYANKV